jgi:hypothetical protein
MAAAWRDFRRLLDEAFERSDRETFEKALNTLEVILLLLAARLPAGRG